jgi:hypothetical protein
MRFDAALALAAMTVACGADPPGAPGTEVSSSASFIKQYEYEEEMYLSLDGTATLYLNSSVPALNALRGTSFDERPNARIDRAAVRTYFTSPITSVTRVSTTRRRNRNFVHVRMKVTDVRRLHDTRPFGWSSYTFGREGELFVYKQAVGKPAGSMAPPAGPLWSGDEIVAFRFHIPSKVAYHNAGAENHRRGNILAWEQPLAERLRGAPLEIDARMQTESILYRTLWLFGATGLAVAGMFAVMIWWIVRRGGRAGAAASVGR